MNDKQVKSAVQKKEKASGQKKGKSAEKKQKGNCKEPEVLIDAQKGSILKVCSGQNMAEWKSLTLLGKLALTNPANKYLQ